MAFGDHETKELIHNYAKNTYRSYSVDELWLMEVITEEEWKLNYDEERDFGITYSTFTSIVKTCRFLKENIDKYSLFDRDVFFEVYSYFPN